MATPDTTVLPGQQTPEQRANAYRDAGLVDPVIGASPVRRYAPATEVGNGQSPYEQAAAGYYGGTEKTAEDPATIRARMMENVQGLVDSIKNTYTGLITRESERGVDRAGQTRARSARQGLLGSDFGAADKTNTENYNADQVKALEVERDGKISALIAGVNQRAEDQALRSKTEASTNTKEWLDYLKGTQTEARSDAVNLFKTGFALEELADDEYRKLLTQTGYTPEQFKALSVINKPEEKVLTSFVQGNKYYVVSQDPITRARKTEEVDLGFAVPKDYTTAKLDDGSLVFYPSKGIDSTKPLDQQLMHYSPAGTTDKYEAEVARINADAAKTRKETQQLGVNPDLSGYTKGQQTTLRDAKVKNPEAAKFFINTEPKFQDGFIQAAAGTDAEQFTLTEIQAAYKDWQARVEAEKKKSRNYEGLFE